MKTILALVVLFFHSDLFGYSGPSLDARNATERVAVWIITYASTRGGKVDVPYPEIPGVSEFLGRTKLAGTFGFSSHLTYSDQESSPAPLVFYVLDDMVVVGYSDMTTRYFEFEPHPPWSSVHLERRINKNKKMSLTKRWRQLR